MHMVHDCSRCGVISTRQNTAGWINKNVPLVCDLRSTVQWSERIPINTSTTLLFQQNLNTPFMTCENAHTHTQTKLIALSVQFSLFCFF